MKKIFYFLSLACVMMLASCSSDDDELIESTSSTETETLGDDIVIGVGMPEDDETRVSMNDLKLTWDDGDQLLAIGLDAQGREMPQKSVFNIIDGVGTKAASFKGKTIPGATEYKIAYKCDGLAYKNGEFSINYTNATQYGFDSEAHLKNYLLLSTEKVQLPTAHNIKLNQGNSVLRIDVHSIPTNLTSVHSIKWFINFTAENQVEMGTLNFSMKAEQIKNIEGHSYIYMPFTPDNDVQLNAGNKIALQFDGNITRTVIATSKGGKQYLKGKRYNIKISTDLTDDKSMNDWIGYDSPLDDEIWAKPIPGGTLDKTKTVTIYVNGDTKNPEKITFTRSDEPNEKGWYVYKTENPVTDAPLMFDKDKNVAEVYLPERIEKMPPQMFCYAENLHNVIMGSNITFIGDATFRGCSNIDNFIVTRTVTSIAMDAFGGYSGKKVTILAHYPIDLGKDIFGKDTPETKPLSNTDLYLHESWKGSGIVSGNRFQTVTFKSITFVNDNNEPVR